MATPNSPADSLKGDAVAPSPSAPLPPAPPSNRLGALGHTWEETLGLIGSASRFRDVLAVVERVAASGCTVLVTGESGTGKELVVRALHAYSDRSDKPFVAVNCGAIPENLLETELFGHAKGAFTGAVSAKQGLVAAAEGGTLFLDEVGELTLPLQVKILRLLQQREFTPVGDTRVTKCNIRVAVATNRDLEDEVAKGRFREDLFYRVNVIHVHLPPLRERREDIEPLALHFFRRCVARTGRPDLTGFSQDAMALMVAHEWPGNVRALENTVERVVLLAPGPLVTPEDLPPRVRGTPESTRIVFDLPPEGVDLPMTLDTLETRLVRQALERTNGNRHQAAKLLGLNRTTLLGIIKRKGI